MKVLVWVILCLIWGSTWIFIKIGLADLPPITFSAARFLLAVLVLVPVVIYRKLELPRNSSEWKLIAFTGTLQFAVNYSAVFLSEQ